LESEPAVVSVFDDGCNFNRYNPAAIATTATTIGAIVFKDICLEVIANHLNIFCILVD
jgi:hypothetical protein